MQEAVSLDQLADGMMAAVARQGRQAGVMAGGMIDHLASMYGVAIGGVGGWRLSRHMGLMAWQRVMGDRDPFEYVVKRCRVAICEVFDEDLECFSRCFHGILDECRSRYKNDIDAISSSVKSLVKEIKRSEVYYQAINAENTGKRIWPNATARDLCSIRSINALINEFRPAAKLSVAEDYFVSELPKTNLFRIVKRGKLCYLSTFKRNIEII